MPTVLRVGRFRFFFFSNEGAEPPHIHIQAAGDQAKFWLDPIGIAANFGFAARDALISRYTLETAQITLGKGPQKGFVGRCTYESPLDMDLARTLTMLADAVFYLGVGMKTARGMGLCRRMRNEG